MSDSVSIANDPLRVARREAVLAAARKVFETKGLDGASVRLIAKEAGCTTGSIYPYFRGKEEIYAEVLSRSLEAYSEGLVSSLVAAGDARARFEAALRSHFGFYEGRSSDLSLALYLFNGLKPQGLTRELDVRLNAQLAAIHRRFTGAFRDLSGCGPEEADAEVGLHFAFLFGLLTLHHTRRTRAFRVDARELLDLHIKRALERFP